MVRLALLLCLLATAPRAQEAAVEDLFTYLRVLPGLERVQGARARGCIVEIIVEERIPGAGPISRELTRLRLSDWVIDGVARPDENGDGGIVLRLASDDAATEIGFYIQMRRNLEGHLRGLQQLGEPLEVVLAEREALIREIREEGRAGTFGDIASRNYVEFVEFLPNDRLRYDWEPVIEVLIALPEDRLNDGTTALAVLQREGCF